ncbi:MAG: bile acid:sodium symporter [Bacteroidaceae bacterium]|nr:bile acid:sodium symporter [Bacteroidaceae bacterium]
MMLQILKNWTMPIAMSVGAFVYFIFAKIQLLEPLKPFVNESVSLLTPTLIFVMLFLTFCKVSPRELRPCRWHIWLIIFQVVTCLALAFFLLFGPSSVNKVAFEAAMVCLICPTATAAAVITSKLGGNASSLTTYTILSNIVTAIIVPIIFPMVEPHEGMAFWSSFWLILGKVFPLLIAPFIAAMLVRRFLPKLKERITACHDLAFYLWSIALAIVVGQTIRSIVHSQASIPTLLCIGGASLATCIMQFGFGKYIGGRYNDRISGGQALGQKNTVFAIWMAYTYLTPLSSLGPGSYVLWQNLFNSWQLWRKRVKEEKANK